MEKAREYNLAVEQGLMDPEYVWVDENDEEVQVPDDREAAAIKLAQELSMKTGGGFVQKDQEDLDDFQAS